MVEDGELHEALVPGTVPVEFQVSPPSTDFFQARAEPEVRKATKAELPEAQTEGTGPGLPLLYVPRTVTPDQVAPAFVLLLSSVLYELPTNRCQTTRRAEPLLLMQGAVLPARPPLSLVVRSQFCAPDGQRR